MEGELQGIKFALSLLKPRPTLPPGFLTAMQHWTAQDFNTNYVPLQGIITVQSHSELIIINRHLFPDHPPPFNSICLTPPFTKIRGKNKRLIFALIVSDLSNRAGACMALFDCRGK